MTVTKVCFVLGAVLSLTGVTVQAQGLYAGASVALTTGPVVVAGVQVGGFVTERLGRRVGTTTDFARGALLDAEVLYAFADGRTCRGYAGGGGSVAASQIYTDGSFAFTLYALATAGAEYRTGRLGIFTELRGRFPHPYVGVAPELRASLDYDF